MTPVRIAERWIGPGHPVWVVAEAGINHDGDPERALALVDAAAAAGADAVKFQTFRTEQLATPAAPKAHYQESSGPRSETQSEMLRRLELTVPALQAVAARARALGILFFSSPFDQASVDALLELGVPALKFGSGELTNLPLLKHAARAGKPLILSTGMATLGEVEQAVRVVTAANSQLLLLHCISSYPASVAAANLRAMATLSAAFAVPVGYSDHTLGIEVSLAAAALGACIIEKHLTLDCTAPGPDHAVSLDPAGFAALVRGIRLVEAALGHGRKEPAPEELEVARVARRSLVLSRDLPAGAVLDEDSIALLRPGTGLPPSALPFVLGRRLNRSVRVGTLLDLEMIS